MEKYGFHKNVLAKIINENGGNTTPCSFDNTVFDSIDTEEKAYWLGFLYADGAISFNKSNHCELSLQLLDAKHLYKFKQFLKCSLNVKYDFKIIRCRITVSNKYFHNRLCELGCVPRKSLILKFPNKNIFKSEDLIKHFIRGYFDGDGCLSHTFCNKRKNSITVSSSLIGTFEFLSVVKEYLLSASIICSNLFKDPKYKHNTYSFHLSKQNSVKFLNLIYSTATIYLDRKYELYLMFAKYKNFAVPLSDYRDYKRAISEKAKLWVNNYFHIDYDTEYANAEITKTAKSF